MIALFAAVTMLTTTTATLSSLTINSLSRVDGRHIDDFQLRGRDAETLLILPAFTTVYEG